MNNSKISDLFAEIRKAIAEKRHIIQEIRDLNVNGFIELLGNENEIINLKK